MDPREISYVTGLPLYIFTQKQIREALGIPHRQVQKLVRFNRDEVMAWAKRWVQDAQDQGIDVKADPAQARADRCCTPWHRCPPDRCIRTHRPTDLLARQFVAGAAPAAGRFLQHAQLQ
ncbi:hypothetical protein [Verminephrobacter eiseniae]|uniref:hypothetical protein n=1 Tax=Verminephrobacter eiseniae TaxID=364317 RepID=UPI0022375B4C|nr:hypothetical protein [Verminephrobacter eiseniae]